MASGGTVTRNFIIRSSGADGGSGGGMGTSTWKTSPSEQPSGTSALKRCGGTCGVRNWTSIPGAMPGGTVTTIFCICCAERLAGLSASKPPLAINPPPLSEMLYLCLVSFQPSTLAACPLSSGFALRPVITTAEPRANLAPEPEDGSCVGGGVYFALSAADSAFHLLLTAFFFSLPARSAGRSSRCSRANSR